MNATQNYKLIGTPQVQVEYSDEFETVMVCDPQRSDGETGDVWIVAGVPDYNQGSSRAAGHQSGFEDVKVFGNSPDHWCPESFDPDDADAIIEACRETALRTHRERRYT